MIRGRLAAPLLCLGLLPGCQALLTEATSTLAGISSASIASGVGADAAETGVSSTVEELRQVAEDAAERRSLE